MKKLINRPEDVVEEMIEGLVLTYPGLNRLQNRTVLVRSDVLDFQDARVSLISGGGSGHEPAHAGYVGRGMLSAAVAGDVFTSPSSDAVLDALRVVGGPSGVLMIVKNYTGDRLNFGIAGELARAEGIPVETVIVADDVALAASVENAGRRGLAGTVLVHKIAGAAAEAGLSLAEVAREARAAADSVRTMGVGLSACTVPAAGRPGFHLGEQEIELGLGIHGEPGVRRGPIESADVLVDRLLEPIVLDLGLPTKDRVVLMINNLGATPTMELDIVARRAITNLENRGVEVDRVYVGTFLSSLEMAGVSISVMRVDDQRLARLDATTEAPAWPNAAARVRRSKAAISPPSPSEAPVSSRVSGPFSVEQKTLLEAAIHEATRRWIEAAPRLTELDQAVGDGDLGISLTRGALAVQNALPTFPLDDPSATFRELGRTLQRSLGGTSGPLYGVFFLRASARLKEGDVHEPGTWASALRSGFEAMQELGGARPGDRTMLDALWPALSAFEQVIQARRSVIEAIRSAVQGAESGVNATAQMIPRRGRSSYLGQRAIGHVDPGAEAVAILFRSILTTLESSDHAPGS